MSAIVCGKRSLFDDLPTNPPVSKRLRCSSTSPIRISPTRPTISTFVPSSSSAEPLLPCPSLYDHNSNTNSPAAAAALDQLRAIFPDMDQELLETALEECSGDLNSAIKSLNELRLGLTERNVRSASDKTEVLPQGIEISCGNIASFEDQSAAHNLPKNGAEWVELFVSEMNTASNIDDARVRASRVLEVLEKSICTHAGAEAMQNFHKENIMLKEQMEVLIRENTILKRAVAIQHERQKEYDTRNSDLQNLKHLVAQYQEQLRTLELSNYELMMHLRQSQQSNTIPGHFHPDVF